MSENIISVENYYRAYNLCKNIDEKDTPFLALALELDAFLRTSDEKLKKGLGGKGVDFFFEYSIADRKKSESRE